MIENHTIGLNTEKYLAAVMSVQSDAIRRGVISMWTIYDHSGASPSFVARRHEVNGTQLSISNQVIECADLGEIQKIFLFAGLYRLPRDLNDEQKILETWL